MSDKAKAVKTRTSPVAFLKQVKAEMKKVTWPTRQETTVTTIAVFIMVFISAMFLFASDQVLSYIVSFILGIGL